MKKMLLEASTLSESFFRQLKGGLMKGGLSMWVSVKEAACQCRRHRFNPWVRNIPWRRARQLTPVILRGESHGRGNFRASPQGHKESNTTEAT